MSFSVTFNDGLAQLRGLGEPTRLRIALLLLQGELSVSDLVDILGQSQPRLSRHLKLMQEAGLILRSPEGAYAYYRLVDNAIIRAVLVHFAQEGSVLREDRARLNAVRQAREVKANYFFAANAEDWDRLRALHIEEKLVEEAILTTLSQKPIKHLLDLGTGTGRMLSLLKNTYEKATGLDSSPAMLNVARALLVRENITNAALMRGDVYSLEGVYDTLLIHQVLHFLEDPEKAVAQSAQVLAKQGRLLVIDFAPHTQEFLRETQNHRRLGFAKEAIEEMFIRHGLTPLSFTLLAPEKAAQLSVCLWLAQKD